ncbi:glutamate-5-semialdehyde dehydrogenase [Alphaproteobacteria bacterium]|nr:glutamate-5-semialdehyde dehydrogenase [Alphaproteobacteria bacterium]
MTQIKEKMIRIGKMAKEAAEDMRKISAEDRSRILMNISEFIKINERKILDANQKDIDEAKIKNLSAPLVNRLILDQKKISALVSTVENIAQMPDPLGQILDDWSQPNGLSFKKITVPLGVIGIIYESRPNVTIDAASLCLRSGNIPILRGGKECIHSNTALYNCIQDALSDLGFNKNLVCFIDDIDRNFVQELIQLSGYVDLIIPRGGLSLIQSISKNSTIPTLKHLNGICHTYWDKGYNKELAEKVIVNAKLRRPEICGATETLLINEKIDDFSINYVLKSLVDQGCRIRGDKKIKSIFSTAEVANDEDWSTEYLDKILSVKMVKNIEEATRHINNYSSGHTESCLTNTASTIDYFFQQCDSAILLHNASTQFADGGEFGFGAEIGISTDKLHVRGPVGAQHLTTFKYLVTGNNQIRPK